jgi:hypothetical protein
MSREGSGREETKREENTIAWEGEKKLGCLHGLSEKKYDHGVGKKSPTH